MTAGPGAGNVRCWSNAISRFCAPRFQSTTSSRLLSNPRRQKCGSAFVIESMACCVNLPDRDRPGCATAHARGRGHHHDSRILFASAARVWSKPTSIRNFAVGRASGRDAFRIGGRRNARRAIHHGKRQSCNSSGHRPGSPRHRAGRIASANIAAKDYRSKRSRSSPPKTTLQS